MKKGKKRAMKLTVRERLLVLMVIPDVGNLTKLEIIRKLKERLSFNEEDNKNLKFKEDPVEGRIAWDKEYEKKMGVKSFEFSEIEEEIIESSLKTAMRRMSATEQMTPEHLAIAKRFLADYDAFCEELKEIEAKQAEAIAVEKKMREERARKRDK